MKTESQHHCGGAIKCAAVLMLIAALPAFVLAAPSAYAQEKVPDIEPTSQPQPVFHSKQTDKENGYATIRHHPDGLTQIS